MVAAQDREWLLDHLNQQVRNLAVLTDWARQHPGDPQQLLRVRDEVFTIRETLDTLGVPHALVTNAEWNRAIGTSTS
jgi:regulator of sirC expression with transglutaminase-like and TPR domain